MTGVAHCRLETAASHILGLSKVAQHTEAPGGQVSTTTARVAMDSQELMPPEDSVAVSVRLWSIAERMMIQDFINVDFVDISCAEPPMNLWREIHKNSHATHTPQPGNDGYGEDDA
jgi:hypothetical protein